MSATGDGGPGGAQRRLIERLRRGMTDRGMKQADLAREAGLSKASVSNILSARAVPTLDTLERLVAAMGIPEQAARELHRLRERAEVRTHRLDSYLTAALGTARNHPYAGVLPGDAPPLTDVYWNQRVHRLGPGDRSGGATRAAVDLPADDLPADDVLAAGETCVVVAGPGGGKSSLLRIWLGRLAERWLAGTGHDAVPVLVPAAALARTPLADALAAVANRELEGLVEALPPAFFSTPPRPSVRWLVLVDGLDEIADPDIRKGVLRNLAAVAGGAYADLYRFVVATRPPPDDKGLDVLGADVPRFGLRPFTVDDLPLVVGGWFRHLRVPDPDLATQRFMRDLSRTRLFELAHVPLMTAMLCRLHAAAPDQPLPDSRGQTYRQFVTLLRKQQYAAGLPYAPAALCAGLERYGTTASGRAENVLDHLEDLISYVAAQRLAGDTRPALSILAPLPEIQVPARVPEDDWQAFLHNALCRSGLLMPYADDLVFLHQTLLEFLAARHIMRDRKTGTRAIRKMFDQSDIYHPLSELAGGVPGVQEIWGRRYWFEPVEAPSYVGFLLDAAQDSGFTLRPSPIRRLADRGGLSGCQYIAALARLGTFLSPEVRDTAARSLHDLFHDPTVNRPSYRVSAAEALAELGDPRGIGLLRDLALDSTVLGSARSAAARLLAGREFPGIAEIFESISSDVDLIEDFPSRSFRLDSAKALMEFDTARVPDLLHELILDPRSRRSQVVNAAQELAGLDRSRAIAALHTRALQANDTSGSRLAVAETSLELGDGTAADQFRSLALDAAIDGSARVEAASALERLGDPLAADLLHSLALDAGCAAYARMQAVEALARLDDSRTPDVFHVLAVDSSMCGFSRVAAAEALMGLDDPRGASLLRCLARDTTVSATLRVRAATRLADTDNSSAADLLHLLALARDTKVGIEASKALIELGDSRGSDHLNGMALDAALDSNSRMRAAETLARLGDPHAAGVCRTLALDATFPSSERVRAADALVKMEDARAPDLLHTLALDPTLSFPARPAETLARLGDPRAAGVFRTLALDAAVDSSNRVRAADALVKMEDTQAADILHTLALDLATETDTSSLADAMKTLAKNGDPRGADLLHVLALDTARRKEGAAKMIVMEEFTVDESALAIHDHMQAVKCLAELGDARAAEHYHTMAMDTTIDASYRTQAAEALDALDDPRAPDILDALSEEPTSDRGR
ncbi:helix-turn-helix domain-containing protein [Streptomyces cyaneofuscatus]